MVRSLDQKVASQTALVTVAKYAPAVFVDSSKQASIFHEDGKPVTKDNPAKRDRKLTLLATGLGPTTGAAITAGVATPASPPAVTDKIQVFFGDPRINGSEIIVDWSGLVPGQVGVYKLDLRVPGNHLKGEALPVTLRIGGVSSPATGTVVPAVAVD